MMKFIDMEVILAIIAVIIVSLVFFVDRAEAASVGTTVTVMISAEVSCNPQNCPEIYREDPVVIENVETQSLWSKIVDIFRFW